MWNLLSLSVLNDRAKRTSTYYNPQQQLNPPTSASVKMPAAVIKSTLPGVCTDAAQTRNKNLNIPAMGKGQKCRKNMASEENTDSTDKENSAPSKSKKRAKICGHGLNIVGSSSLSWKSYGCVLRTDRLRRVTNKQASQDCLLNFFIAAEHDARGPSLTRFEVAYSKNHQRKHVSTP